MRRILTWLMVAILIFSASAGMMTASAATSTKTSTKISEDDQDKLDGLKASQKDLTERIKQLKEEIKQTENKRSDLLRYQQSIAESIRLTKQQIQNLDDQIAILESQIEQKELEIADKSEEIEVSKDLLRERLRAMQQTKTQSNLSIIFSTDNFSDMMAVSMMFERIAENDQSLIDTLFSEKTDIEEIRAAIAAQKLEADEKRAEQADIKADLDEQNKKNNKALEEIKKYEAELEKERKAAEEEQKRVEKEIADIYASYESLILEYVGGEFVWPVPGYYTISSRFGQREINGKQDNHTGMDITGSGVRGAKIVAVNEGTVMAVRSYTSGYGNHLIIDHGGSISTLYAHCQSVIVKEGQWVAQGQTIAYVGSTGWSTGPHLHFEVRINGKAVNPEKYVKG